MNTLFYTILFIIGCVIGNFWTIQSRKLPKSLDLKKTNYSKNPNEELISKMCYIIIGGLSSVILANVLNVNIDEFDILNSVIYIFSMLYISTLVLIAGIDRNYSKIEKNVLAFGIISSIIYMLYLCMIDLTSIYLNGMFLAMYFVLLVIDTFLLRRYAKDSYIINILMLLVIMLVFTNLPILIDTLIMALIATTIYTLILVRQKKKKGNKKIKISEIPVGYFISVCNIIVLFMVRIFENYYI